MAAFAASVLPLQLSYCDEHVVARKTGSGRRLREQAQGGGSVRGLSEGSCRAPKSLVRFWSLFVSMKIQNSAVIPQRLIVLIVLINNHHNKQNSTSL